MKHRILREPDRDAAPPDRDPHLPERTAALLEHALDAITALFGRCWWRFCLQRV